MSDNDSKYVVFPDVFEKYNVLLNLFENNIKIKKNDEISIDNFNYSPLKNEVQQYVKLKRQYKDTIVLGIATTFNCNLACTYCYEKGAVLKTKSISESKSNDICEFIFRYVEYYNAKNIWIVFTGGEPLINYQAILDISNTLYNKYDNKENINFSFSIVSNGTIKLKDDVIDKLVKYGLKHFQISLDGPKEIHNKRRLATFDSHARTIEFIKHCAEKEIEVAIRTTVDKENIQHYEKMLNELAEIDVIRKSKVCINVYETEETLCERCERLSLNNNSVLPQAIQIVKKSCFELASRKRFYKGCMSFVEVGLFIDPDGNLYKCGGMLGYENEIVGSIYNLDNTIINVKEYIDKKISEECKKCNLFPFCVGGCIYQKHYNNSCSEEYKNTIRNLLKNNLMEYLTEKGFDFD